MDRLLLLVVALLADDESEPRGGWPARCVVAARVAGVAVVVVGVAMLLLEALGVEAVGPGPLKPLRMAPASASSFVLGGLALSGAVVGDGRRRRRLVDACAVAMVALVCVGLLSPRIGLIRPAFNTVAAVTLLAGALAALVRPARAGRVGQALALAGLLIALLATAGYVYRSPVLYRAVEHVWGMSLVTALTIVLLGAGILCARPEVGFMALVVDASPSGRLLRRLLPLVLAVPVGALLLARVAQSGLLGGRTLAAVLAVAGMVAATLAVFVDARALARVSALRARLDQLFASSSDAIIDTAPGGTVYSWNAAAERLFGYPASEMLGRSIAQILPPERKGEIFGLRAEVLAGGGSRGFEGWRVRKDGSRFYGSTVLSPVRDGAGRIVGVSAIVRDISERVAAEEALERAHDRERTLRRAEEAERTWLASVLDHLPTPVVLVDAAGRIRRLNRAALALARHDGAGVDPFGNPVVLDLRRASGEALPPEAQPLVRALRRRETVAGEALAARGDGERAVPLLVGATPVYAPSGEMLGAALVASDISAAKELERLREEWTAIVAHDLRQPVGVIVLAAGVLAASVQGERARAAAARIERSATRLARMIGDLLDSSQLDARRLRLERARVDVAALVRDVVGDLGPALGGHRVELHAPAGALFADVDAGRVAQVLGNLLTNAAKYASADSAIAVTVEPCAEGVACAVANQGPGLGPDELRDVFQRFRRGRGTRGSGVPGLGLGLFIARGLVEAHGGRIWAESVPGGTTTFRFTLPTTAQPQPQPAPAGAH